MSQEDEIQKEKRKAMQKLKQKGTNRPESATYIISNTMEDETRMQLAELQRKFQVAENRSAILQRRVDTLDEKQERAASQFQELHSRVAEVAETTDNLAKSTQQAIQRTRQMIDAKFKETAQAIEHTNQNITELARSTNQNIAELTKQMAMFFHGAHPMIRDRGCEAMSESSQHSFSSLQNHYSNRNMEVVDQMSAPSMDSRGYDSAVSAQSEYVDPEAAALAALAEI